jgi:hypothetical protein
VAQQENPNGFPSHARNQFAFDGFLRYQAYRPTCTAFRRATAYHCNQTLFLTIVKYLGCSGSLSLIQRPIQTALPITAADIADGLCCQRNYASNAGRDGAFGQLQKGESAQHDTNLLDSAAHQFSEFFLILGRHFNAQGWTSHALSMGQNISNWNCFIAKTLGGQRPSAQGDEPVLSHRRRMSGSQHVLPPKS